MSNLLELISLCKGSVYVHVNDHLSFYDSVERAVSEIEPNDTTDEMRAKMIEKGTVVRVQAYPNTQVSFHLVYHYDVDMAIDEMIRLIKE